MRILRYISALAVLATPLAGCRDRAPEPPRMSEVLPNMPLPPLASFVSRSGGEDAVQVTFRSTLPPDSMANWYRGVLTRGEWSLVSDTRTREGVLTLYAERNGPPLWVTISRDSLSAGSMVSIGGAMVGRDSAKPAVDTTKRS